MAGFDCFFQCFFVNQPAARAVDDTHAFFALTQTLGVQQVAGCIRQRGMQRNEIGAFQQFIQLDLLDIQCGRPLGPRWVARPFGPYRAVT